MPARLLAIKNPREHLEAIHRSQQANGCLSLLILADGQPSQHTFRLDDSRIDALLSTYKQNIFATPNSFKGSRAVANLLQLHACYIDIDSTTDPAHVLDAPVAAPSLLIASGRGLHAYWIFDAPVPRYALPRWQAMQDHLCDALQGDTRAKDAARVLRLVGTINSKTGRKVEVIGGSGRTWDFDLLADEVLPYTREEVSRYKAQVVSFKTHKKVVKARSKRRLASRYEAIELWQRRYDDIMKYIELEYSGKLPEGKRDNFLFCLSVAMSYIVHPSLLQREIEATADKLAGWPSRETKSRLCSVIRRAILAGQGKVITWQGKKVDARYRMRTTTLRRFLDISIEDIKKHDLRSLMTRSERKEIYNAKRYTHDKKKAVDERYETIKRLLQEGLSKAEIAKRLGISRELVRYTIKSRKSA